MQSDAFRVAGWCAVILAALVFIVAVQRLSDVPPVPKPPETVSQSKATPPRVPELEPAPEPQPETREARYVGNTNSHKFHTMSCKYARCENCTARFTSRDEAIASGYRPGGCCDP